MVDQALKTEQLPLGEIVAQNVSAEDFMEHYADQHYEWVRGYVIKMSPVSLRHYRIVEYLADVFRAYFTLNPIGTMVGDPFVMRVDITETRREPDLQIVLNTNTGKLTETAMIGPADICIEVVSRGSIKIDRGEKFEEYEKGGVKEYWIIDPLREECAFYRLNEEGVFIPQKLDETESYQTPLLPKLRLHVPTLWGEKLPDIFVITAAVRTMVEGEEQP